MIGKFIVLEGGDGSGKTVQLRRLEEKLKSLNIPFITTEQPGGTAIGKRIREIILKEPIAPLTELLLYASDRAEHVSSVIRPALKEGKIVLCSRYTHSTIAYQCYGRGLDRGLVDQLNELATGGLKPDRTIWLDVRPEVGLSRAKGRDALDRLEQCDIEFHCRVRSSYQDLHRVDYGFFRVDAEQSEDRVFLDLWELLKEAIARTTS